MAFPANSFRDLAFLIPEGFKEGDPPPPKFLVFFSDRKVAAVAAQYLQSRLPGSRWTKSSGSTLSTHPNTEQRRSIICEMALQWGIAVPILLAWFVSISNLKPEAHQLAGG